MKDNFGRLVRCEIDFHVSPTKKNGQLVDFAEDRQPLFPRGKLERRFSLGIGRHQERTGILFSMTSRYSRPRSRRSPRASG